MIRSMLAPSRSSSSLGLNFGAIDVRSGLSFDHEYGRIRFCYEVRDILRLRRAYFVVNLELSLCGLEPLQSVPLKNNREAPLRIGVEFL